MIDGLYQSVICFFMAYCLFFPANAVTDNGLSIDDRERFGAYVAPAAVIAINTYICSTRTDGIGLCSFSWS